MKTQAQEIVAQAMFWSGIGSLPLSITMFVVAFRNKTRWEACAMFTLGSVALTHFLWYFNYLGGSLATKVDKFYPTPWHYFYPTAFVITAILTGIYLGWRYVKTTPPELNLEAKSKSNKISQHVSTGDSRARMPSNT